MLVALQDLLKKGHRTDVRLFDEWFEGPLTWIKKRLPWVTPNIVTGLRLAVLVLTLTMLSGDAHAALATISAIRVFDGYTDVADGVWARRFGHSTHWVKRWKWLDRGIKNILGSPATFGQFFDQASDKMSNWLFIIALLYYADVNVYMAVALGPTSLFVVVLGFAMLCDAYNLIVRVKDYHKPTLKNARKSGGIGKVKTWLQAFGSIFLTVATASKLAATGSSQHVIATAFCLIVTWGLGCALIPMVKVNGRWKQPWWRTVAQIVLTVIVAMNLWSWGRITTNILGEVVLYASVILASLSTYRQMLPSPATVPTSDGKTVVVDKRNS